MVVASVVVVGVVATACTGTFHTDDLPVPNPPIGTGRIQSSVADGSGGAGTCSHRFLNTGLAHPAWGIGIRLKTIAIWYTIARGVELHPGGIAVRASWTTHHWRRERQALRASEVCQTPAGWIPSAPAHNIKVTIFFFARKNLTKKINTPQQPRQPRGMWRTLPSPARATRYLPYWTLPQHLFLFTYKRKPKKKTRLHTRSLHTPRMLRVFGDVGDIGHFGKTSARVVRWEQAEATPKFRAGKRATRRIYNFEQRHTYVLLHEPFFLLLHTKKKTILPHKSKFCKNETRIFYFLHIQLLFSKQILQPQVVGGYLS